MRMSDQEARAAVPVLRAALLALPGGPDRDQKRQRIRRRGAGCDDALARATAYIAETEARHAAEVAKWHRNAPKRQAAMSAYERAARSRGGPQAVLNQFPFSPPERPVIG